MGPARYRGVFNAQPGSECLRYGFFSDGVGVFYKEDRCDSWRPTTTTSPLCRCRTPYCMGTGVVTNRFAAGVPRWSSTAEVNGEFVGSGPGPGPQQVYTVAALKHKATGRELYVGKSR